MLSHCDHTAASPKRLPCRLPVPASSKGFPLLLGKGQARLCSYSTCSSFSHPRLLPSGFQLPVLSSPLNVWRPVAPQVSSSCCPLRLLQLPWSHSCPVLSKPTVTADISFQLHLHPQLSRRASCKCVSSLPRLGRTRGLPS